MENPASDFALSEKRIYFFLVLACLLAFANSLGGDFLFDDEAQIVGNTAIRSWRNVFDAFTTDVWAFQRETSPETVPPPYYRPIFTIYLTLGYQLFGLWQQGWHLLNLAAHTGATVLAFRLFRRLSDGNLRLSFVAALFFALTPVHVESVAWISGVPDPLAALFYIPAMIFYIRWREESNKKFLGLSLLCFFLSLLCKETPIVLPAILFVWEITLNRKNESVRFFDAFRQVLIFAVPAAVYLAMRFAVLGKITWKHPYVAETPPELIYATVPFVLVSYLKNIIFPFDLSLVYNTRFVTGWNDALLWLPLLILAGIAALLYVFRRKTTPLMRLALALFIVPLVPVLNLKVFHYEYIVQDRYLYLPSIGFFLFVGCLLEKLWTAKKESFQKSATAVSALLCLAYAAGTFRHNRVWNSELNLWTRALEVKPESWSIHYNLGRAHYNERNYAAAIENLNEAIKHQSFTHESALIYSNRGLAYKASGKPDEAAKDFAKSLEINPKSLEANTNLGALLFDKGDYAGAEAQFKKAVQINPFEPSANYNLARTWAKLNRHREALGIYEKLLKSAPADAELLYQASISYAAAGQRERAAELLDRAARAANDETLKKQIAAEREKLK